MQNKFTSYLKNIILIISICIISVFILIFILKKYIYPRECFDIIKEQAKINNIDPYLVLAIIKTESDFNNNAVSSKEAKGLMQLMDSTATELSNSINYDISNLDIFDEKTNITLGCKYLSNLINKYEGNYYLAVCAYNAGMGNVDKWITQGSVSKTLDKYKNVKLPFKETTNYLNKVVSSYKMYRLLYK